MKFIDKYEFYKCNSTLDLVNGLHLTITFADACVSPGDIYQIIPMIIKNLYSALGSPVECPVITTAQPSVSDLVNAQGDKKLFLVMCIAPNSNTLKYHLHAFVYNLHNFSVDFKCFFKAFDRSCRKIPGISSRGWPVFYSAVTDPIDKQIRKDGFEYLIDYIKKREYPSLMNYLHAKNSKDFLYHYV